MPTSSLYNSVQVRLRGIVGLVPDHHNKASITIKPIAIFLLMEGLALNLWKTQFVNSNKANCNKMRYVYTQKFIIFFFNVCRHKGSKTCKHAGLHERKWLTTLTQQQLPPNLFRLVLYNYQLFAHTILKISNISIPLTDKWFGGIINRFSSICFSYFSVALLTWGSSVFLIPLKLD